MSYNIQLVIRDKYSETILDLVDLSNQIKMSDIKSDLKVSEGSRLSGIQTGIGMISVGRKLDFGIPIFEYRNDKKQWVKLDEQYTKYTSIILSNSIKRYYIRTVFDNEIYEAEHIITSVGGYTVKYINNIGVITISLQALDKIFLRQKEDSYQLNVSGDSKQDINYKSLSLVPVPISFNLEFLVIAGQLEFTFANRQNFGIQCVAELQGGNYTVDFNGENLTINGVSYNFKGIQPELNVGDNVFYLETNQTCTSASIRYKRGILI
ncbi:hypothetical protein [Brachyspira hyodysenteriae]|uniref:hypothetical protein n=1 Tax=Brachyspira hyodysenteriae TaxID=159 RepID=UPI00063DCD02|nr:hypothetical protein [Brachyspira hyodysenteriae]KLI59529.1 hypothetical protein SZ44_08140 [Brachyspira hyodysenteriae]